MCFRVGSSISCFATWDARVPLQLPSYCLHLKDDTFVPIHWVFVIPGRDWFLLAIFFCIKIKKRRGS